MAKRTEEFARQVIGGVATRQVAESVAQSQLNLWMPKRGVMSP